MRKCTFLVGVPGSGKSTWVDAQKDFNTFVVSTDRIIEDIANTYMMTYDAAFKDLIGFAEKTMFNRLAKLAEAGSDIYIDRTNLSVKSRKRIIDILKPFGYNFKAVVFPVPDKEEWQRRLDSRLGKTIPKHVLESMAMNFQHPMMEEGFSKISYV